MAKDYVGVYRSLLDSSKFVDTAKQDTRPLMGNGNGATILRPSIA